MGVLAKIKRALSLMCVIFTAVMSLMYAAGWLASGQETLFVPTPSKALTVLLFCGILGFASLLLSKEGTPVWRYVLHFLISLTAFIAVFLVGGGFPLTGGSSIVATVLYLLVYAAAMVIRGLVCRRSRSKATEAEEYTSVFK